MIRSDQDENRRIGIATRTKTGMAEGVTRTQGSAVRYHEAGGIRPLRYAASLIDDLRYPHRDTPRPPVTVFRQPAIARHFEIMPQKMAPETCPHETGPLNNVADAFDSKSFLCSSQSGPAFSINPDNTVIHHDENERRMLTLTKIG